MGRRRAPSDLRADPGIAGLLYFGPVPIDDYGHRMEARLLDRPGGKDLILPLQFAQILRIQGVMHLTGKEYFGRGLKSKVQVWNQSWMCCHDPLDAQHLIAKVQPRGMVAIFGDEDMMD